MHERSRSTVELRLEWQGALEGCLRPSKDASKALVSRGTSRYSRLLSRRREGLTTEVDMRKWLFVAGLELFACGGDHLDLEKAGTIREPVLAGATNITDGLSGFPHSQEAETAGAIDALGRPWISYNAGDPTRSFDNPLVPSRIICRGSRVMGYSIGPRPGVSGDSWGRFRIETPKGYCAALGQPGDDADRATGKGCPLCIHIEFGCPRRPVGRKSNFPMRRTLQLLLGLGHYERADTGYEYLCRRNEASQNKTISERANTT
jgi:hypothetical protein